MSAVVPTRLETWVAERLKGYGYSLDRLGDFQLSALNRTLFHTRTNSPFYRRRLQDHPQSLSRLDRLSGLPFTTAEDLRRHHLEMLCTSHSDVARVVTLQTSGTTAAPKRLYFSLADLELTVDFFHHGMACVVCPGQKVLILLPGTTPDSVGDLLKRGLTRMSVEGHIHWPVTNLDTIIDKIKKLNIDGLVGSPSQIMALCRYDAGRKMPPGRLKSILLSTDHVPRVVVEELKRVWGCSVFEHYGMTEMGLGGGLDCAVHNGYHLREPDLLVEIVDPRSGRPLPPGIAGEVVFTTLTRQAMPLIRYRTGDRAAWMEGICPCGSRLRRLGIIRGRMSASDSDDGDLSLPLLDETILAFPEIFTFKACRETCGDRETLTLTLFCPEDSAHRLQTEVLAAVKDLMARQSKTVQSVSVITHPPETIRWEASGMMKRTIETKGTC